jgi:hypothetical protein
MDEPARKRRKTSSPPAQPSSSLRKPARRPSFASPTKASLARNYPNLLPSRPTTAGPASRPGSRGDVLARGKQARAYVLGETDVQESLSQELAQDNTAVDADAGAQQRYKEVQSMTPRTKRVIGHRSAAFDVGARADEEPDLPTTPSQQGLEKQDEPRRGVLFSSPSKRPPRALGPVKHSPLRPKAPPVQEASPTQHIEDGPDDTQSRNGVERAQTPDPEVEKKKQEKVRLEREIAELEAQVTQCAQEIAKEQQRTPAEPLRPSEQSILRAFIAKLTSADTTADTPPPLSTLLNSFLPFSTTISAPRPQPLSAPIPSHRPIDLPDPLPYLRLFTSLTYTSHLTFPRGKFSPSSSRVHQNHTIDIAGPQNLLTAQMSITIDALANEIIDMQLLRLSPWAERELGRYVRERAEQKDLSNACWAIDSFWCLARKRAEYWRACETAFSYLLTSSQGTENIPPQSTTSKSKTSRKSLNRHLGRDSLILQDSHVLLKINWGIGFDWTGEAESDVSVEAAFPAAWTEGDKKGVFGKVPETFGALVRAKGVLGGTRVVVGLLFSGSESEG